MPANLTGLNPNIDYSKKLMEEAFPGGKAGVPEEALMSNFKTRIWGTGAAPGVASYFARRGFEESDPGFQYEFARQMKEAEQELANQYQTRQINALNANRTAVLTEPTFRASVEAPVSGYYEGQPTLARTEAENRQRSLEAYLANENRKFELEKWKSIFGGVGSVAERSGLLDWFFGSRLGTGTGGGLLGSATQGVVNAAAKKAWDLITGATSSLPYLSAAPLSQEAFTIAQNLMAQGIPQNIAFEAANATAVEGLAPGGESISNYLANFSNALAPAAGAGAGAAAAGAGFLAPGGVGPAASSIEAGLIEMLGPELAAQLGFTTAPAGAAAGAGAVGATAPAWASALPFAAFLLPAMMPLLVGDQSGAIEDAEARAAQADIYAHPEIAEEMIRNPYGRPRAYRSAMENHRDANIRNRFMAALGGTSIDWQPEGQREQDARVQEAIQAIAQGGGPVLTPEEYAWINSGTGR